MRRIRLTQELIEQGSTPKGGYSKGALKCLDVDWPPKKGWKANLVGESVLYDDYLSFVEINKALKPTISQQSHNPEVLNIDKWIANNKSKKRKRKPPITSHYTIPKNEIEQAINKNNLKS